MNREEVEKTVIDCFSQSTGYPPDMFERDRDVDLENGLGIDSLKRIEMAVKIADQFSASSGDKFIVPDELVKPRMTLNEFTQILFNTAQQQENAKGH